MLYTRYPTRPSTTYNSYDKVSKAHTTSSHTINLFVILLHISTLYIIYVCEFKLSLQYYFTTQILPIQRANNRITAGNKTQRKM